MAKKILLVDDEPNMLKVISLRLKAGGYEVTTVCDGYQALATAHSLKPDIIILDIKIPAGNGIRVFQKLRLSSDTMGIPIIFITAYADDEVLKLVSQLDTHVDGFLVKPFSTEVLLEKVKQIIGG